MRRLIAGLVACLALATVAAMPTAEPKGGVTLMAKGDPLTSPWVWSAPDYLGRAITLTVNFNNGTFALQNSTVVRASGCLYGHLYIGLGGDGSPNSTPKQFAIPVGTTTITAGQLAANGLNTINDVLALQITAGP